MSDARPVAQWLLIPVGQQAGGAWVDDTVAANPDTVVAAPIADSRLAAFAGNWCGTPPAINGLTPTVTFSLPSSATLPL